MKSIVTFLIIPLLASCAANPENTRRSVPNPQMAMTFENSSIKKDSASTVETLTSLFKLGDSAVEKVTVHFDDRGQLHLDFEDTYGRRSNYGFGGKFRKKHYEYSIRNSHKGIPPFYWITDVERLRVWVEPDGTLIVERYFNRSGMILLMAGGASDKKCYRFKSVANANRSNLNPSKS